MASIRDRFVRDHEDLELQVEDLANAVEGADFPTIQAIWARFERFMLGHIAAEEEHALGRFEEVDPAAAKQIRDEHDQIRQAIAEIGVEGELKTLRKERADAFIALLAAHREREDALFYGWADEKAPDGVARLLLDALRRLRKDDDA